MIYNLESNESLRLVCFDFEDVKVGLQTFLFWPVIDNINCQHILKTNNYGF